MVKNLNLVKTIKTCDMPKKTNLCSTTSRQPVELEICLNSLNMREIT